MVYNKSTIFYIYFSQYVLLISIVSFYPRYLIFKMADEAYAWVRETTIKKNIFFYY